MVSCKAGIPLAEARKLLSFPVVPELSEKCPRCGKKLKLRMGKNGLFVACSGYPTCTFTENIPDPDEDVVDVTELEKHDVRRVRLADEAAPEPRGRDVSRLLGVPEVPQRRQRRNGRRARPRRGRTSRRGRSVPSRATRSCAATAASAPTSRAAATRTAGTSRPSRSTTPASPVPRTAAASPSGAGRFRPFYGCVNYPKCDFTLSARPIPEACPSAATRTCCCASARAATRSPATRAAADSRSRPARSPRCRRSCSPPRPPPRRAPARAAKTRAQGEAVEPHRGGGGRDARGPQEESAPARRPLTARASADAARGTASSVSDTIQGREAWHSSGGPPARLDFALPSSSSSALPAGAFARELHWSAMDVRARLDDSGTLHVVERQAMVFTGDWNGGERIFRCARARP